LSHGFSRRRFIVLAAASATSITTLDPFRLALPPPARQTTPRDWVTNGSFENAMAGWKLNGHPRPVSIVEDTAHSGLHSLRIIGPNEGLYQELLERPRIISMDSTTRAEFFVRLDGVSGEKDPQALFHLYFLPHRSWPRYSIEINVTHEDKDDTEGPPIDRDPGRSSGKVAYAFNRTPLNEWTRISLDTASTIRKYFPEYYESEISGVLLDSSEGGKVYYDDVSIRSSSNPTQPFSFLYFVLSDTFVGHFLAALAGLLGFISASFTVRRLLRASKAPSERNADSSNR